MTRQMDSERATSTVPDERTTTGRNAVRTLRHSATLLLLTSAVCAPSVAQIAPRVFEAYPDEIQARLEARDRRLLAAPRFVGGEPFSLVITNAQLWPQRVVTVSFNGGDQALRGKIAALMDESSEDATWSHFGNIVFDFGDSEAGYRSWSTMDTEYSSDIRISFAYQGYWSLVGTDSVDPEIVSGGDPSMNLAGFDNDLPDDWKTTTLHEFGHALGFKHEHQSPAGGCDAEFRWEDDANGTPGIYTLLGGPPNNWPQWKVDHNLRQLESSDAYTFSAHDTDSIMHYSFPTWMFHRGQDSHCYTEENMILSELDEEGMLTSYPLPPPEGAAADLGGSSKAKSLGSLRELSELDALSEGQRSKYKALYDRVQENPQ